MSFLRSILPPLLFAATLASPMSAATLGDDGLHDEPWIRETFKDLREDLAEANSENKRLMVLIEQRGCIYCTRMHEEVFSDPEIASYIADNYFVVQLNMFGDVEVTDFDGQAMSEKDAIRRWQVMFTPTLMFFPPEVPEGVTAPQAAAAVMPGAFGKSTTRHMMEWVLEEGYLGDENFQKYHARKLNEENG